MASYLAHQAAIDAAMQRVLNSGWSIPGQEVKSLEQKFAANIGVCYAIRLKNCTEVLKFRLREHA